MKLLYLPLLTVLKIWSLVESHLTIRLYGDVRRNTEFFTTLFPYLMDNLGPHLTVDYNILGHGIYAAGHMCALKQLANNNILAAYFLKCEAEGRHPETCLCESGIDEGSYRFCVRTEGNALAKKAYWNYAQPYGSDWTPILEYAPNVGKPIWSVQGLQNSTVYWDSICGMFKNPVRPWICLHPLNVKPQKPGVARCQCNKPRSGLSTRQGAAMMGLDYGLSDPYVPDNYILNLYSNDTIIVIPEFTKKRRLRGHHYRHG